MLKKNSKIYVAGHTGLVGSAIVRKLKKLKYTNIITIDTELMIYKPYLQAISKYKLADLQDMCNEVGLSTSLNGKNKLKKELYDNINQYYVQKD